MAAYHWGRQVLRTKRKWSWDDTRILGGDSENQGLWPCLWLPVFKRHFLWAVAGISQCTLVCLYLHVLGFFSIFLFSPFILFISWRLIILQYCSGFCHTLTWIGHGFTCVPHLDPPSHLPLCAIPLGLPSAPGPSTCLMRPTWAGDLFHYR